MFDMGFERSKYLKNCVLRYCNLYLEFMYTMDFRFNENGEGNVTI